jgi:hypothetical protein
MVQSLHSTGETNNEEISTYDDRLYGEKINRN